jgi:hypothetical protein
MKARRRNEDVKSTNAVTKKVWRKLNMGFVFGCLQTTSLSYKSTIYNYLHSQKTTLNYLKATLCSGGPQWI